jgi:hypothetical protein
VESVIDYLKERILLFLFELVGTKNLKTALGLRGSETLVIALEERKDILDDNGLEVDFFLVIKVISFELDL